MSPLLPVELVAAIVSQLSVVHDKPTLASCCRASSSLRSVAEPLLYSSIVLRFGQLPPFTQVGEDQASLLDTKSMGCLCRVFANDDMQKVLQSVTVVNVPDQLAFPHEPVKHHLPWTVGFTVACLIKHCVHLRRLALMYFTRTSFGQLHTPDLLSALASLELLHLVDPFSSLIWQQPPPLLISKVTALTLTLPATPSLPNFAFFTSLESLTFHIPSESAPIFLHHSAVTQHSLHFLHPLVSLRRLSLKRSRLPLEAKGDVATANELYLHAIKLYLLDKAWENGLVGLKMACAVFGIWLECSTED
ncbi:hypothetical protein JCM5296_001205 [Sporobolomyces johnsonii]